ncbi:MAG: GNAT family N-acetyltransferase [Candidatus Nitrosocosmicus sp.]
MTEHSIDFIILNDEINLSHLDFKDEYGYDSEILQWFIKKHVHNHHKANLGLIYIICYNGKNIGYVTLATSSIEKKSTEVHAPATPHLPSIIIAYFAIDRNYRGIGIGTKVLFWVFGLARKIGEDVGCRFITLYAKNAINFYEDNGYNKTEVSTEDGFVLMYKDLFPDRESGN